MRMQYYDYSTRACRRDSRVFLCVQMCVYDDEQHTELVVKYRYICADNDDDDVAHDRSTSNVILLYWYIVCVYALCVVALVLT